MSDAPGIPKIASRFWLVLGVIFLVMGISYALLALPSFLGINAYASSTIGFTLYAFIGWIFLYSAGTISDLKDLTEDEFNALMNTMEWPLTGFIFLIVGCYVNFLLVLSTGIGIGLTELGASPAIAMIAAMLYPGLDTILGRKWFMPGRTVITAVVWAFHAFGYLRNLTVGDVYSFMSGAKNPV